MTTKEKNKDDAKTISAANTLKVAASTDKTNDRQLAEIGLSPLVANTITAQLFGQGTFGKLDLSESVNLMRERVSKVQEGDLSYAEAALTAQAATLDAIFNELARRAALNMGAHLNATETYMRIALKAQAQCRATLETLAEVKYPKVATFVRQQNVAYQQQVNNGNAADNKSNTHTPAHGKSLNQSNELLEAQHGERLDSRTTDTAIGINSQLEAMGEINGGNVDGGQGKNF